VSAGSTSAMEQAVLSASPLLAAPRQGSLPELGAWQHRYIAAAGGLYFQAATPHYQLLAAYAEFDDETPALPYGELKPYFTFLGGGLPGDLFRELCKRAIERATTEGAWLVLDSMPQGLKLTVPNQVSAGSGHMEYTTAEYQSEKVVVDVHSHGAYDAFFSGTDDASEDGAYVAMVFGKTLGMEQLQVTARACFFGRTFPLDLAWGGDKLHFDIGGPCGASPSAYGALELIQGDSP
jgi:PRTRC genetic system protein A